MIKKWQALEQYIAAPQPQSILVIACKSGSAPKVPASPHLFYVQRMKRMIITSGYNVYPSHIEKILEEHEYVDSCGVIGIPDPYKIEVPKAFIVLKKGIEATPETTKILKEYCYKNLSKYMIPKKFEYRESLPKTLVGKIDYRKLEK